MEIRSVVRLIQFVSVRRWLTSAKPAFQEIFFRTTFFVYGIYLPLNQTCLVFPDGFLFKRLYFC
jgi:hypothetical protein